MFTWKMNALKLSTEIFDHLYIAKYSELHMLQNNLNILCIKSLDLAVRPFKYASGVSYLGGGDCCGNCNC